MSTSMSLSMGQTLLLSTLATIAVVYVAYFRIWSALAIASDLLFATALTVCVTCVVAPGVFDGLARVLIDRSPLPAALGDADARVEALAALPGELIDRALERIGLGDEPEGPLEPEPEPPLTRFEIATGATLEAPETVSDLPPPEATATATDETAALLIEEAGLEGLFTRSIRPPVEALVAVVLRGSTLVVSGLLLVLSLASRASTTTAKRLRALAERLDALEARHGAAGLPSRGRI